MTEQFTPEQRENAIKQMLFELGEQNELLKQELRKQEGLLFNAFRLAHPDFFSPDLTANSKHHEFVQPHFQEYLLKLSRMNPLTYYLG
ncbi:hypothetical protein ACFS6H_16670 [Terrimonas rubra]|uniref:Uncharacterized protein n=1 Tax=Terrimonas rubra TaxID=1035890 RepID=A0ABW6ABM2_9BACT